MAPARRARPADVGGQVVGPSAPAARRTVAHYLVEIAKLGGYLARAKDPPPGNLVIWRGLIRLADILSGFELKNRGCG
ncbi:MAG TPA: hypothetical protein VKE74_22315 [Gemmataceae bacterium]|nr:hypothetical protein [Gemmataceae bacterium]